MNNEQTNTMLDEIVDAYGDENFLIADGFNDAILGIDENTYRLIYSVKACIDILISQGMNDEDAMEYFNFNVSGAYMGEKTPIWCNDLF